MNQELNKKEAEEHILELMKSDNVEDVLLGARLAVQVMGREWCYIYPGPSEHHKFKTNKESTYYICKREGKHYFWGIHCTYYLTFWSLLITSAKSHTDLTIIDITDL